MYLVNRSKHCSVKEVNGDLCVKAILLDSVHEMVMEVLASADDLFIKKVTIQMLRVPDKLCLEMVNKVKSLEGLQVGAGITKKVMEKIGQSEGCFHISDLFMEAVKALRQGQYYLRYKNSPNREGHFTEVKKELKGTCYRYSHKQ